MTCAPDLNELTPEQLRALAAQLLSQVDTMGKKIHCRVFEPYAPPERR